MPQIASKKNCDTTDTRPHRGDSMEFGFRTTAASPICTGRSMLSVTAEIRAAEKHWLRYRLGGRVSLLEPVRDHARRVHVPGYLAVKTSRIRLRTAGYGRSMSPCGRNETGPTSCPADASCSAIGPTSSSRL